MSYYQDIADRLVQDGHLLTALELHIELEERGISLKTLKEFFENSSNFEKYTRQSSVPKKTPSPAESISSITGSQVKKSLLQTLSNETHIRIMIHLIATSIIIVCILLDYRWLALQYDEVFRGLTHPRRSRQSSNP